MRCLDYWIQDFFAVSHLVSALGNKHGKTAISRMCVCVQKLEERQIKFTCKGAALFQVHFEMSSESRMSPTLCEPRRCGAQFDKWFKLKTPFSVRMSHNFVCVMVETRQVSAVVYHHFTTRISTHTCCLTLYCTFY